MNPGVEIQERTSAVPIHLKPPALTGSLQVGGHSIPVFIIQKHSAKRYRVEWQVNGSLLVIVPRGGTLSGAWNTAMGCYPWLWKNLPMLLARPRKPLIWPIGTKILFRGQLHTIERGYSGCIQFGSEVVCADGATVDTRPVIAKHLRGLAERELPFRLLYFSALHDLRLRRIQVGSYKAQWGCCNSHHMISLTWQLVQLPIHVRDYVLLHELMHLRQMNHAPQFWAEVRGACPGYKEARECLKEHSSLLRGAPY